MKFDDLVLGERYTITLYDGAPTKHPATLYRLSTSLDDRAATFTGTFGIHEFTGPGPQIYGVEWIPLTLETLLHEHGPIEIIDASGHWCEATVVSGEIHRKHNALPGYAVLQLIAPAPQFGDRVTLQYNEINAARIRRRRPHARANETQTQVDAVADDSANYLRSENARLAKKSDDLLGVLMSVQNALAQHMPQTALTAMLGYGQAQFVGAIGDLVKQCTTRLDETATLKRERDMWQKDARGNAAVIDRCLCALGANHIAGSGAAPMELERLVSKKIDALRNLQATRDRLASEVDYQKTQYQQTVVHNGRVATQQRDRIVELEKQVEAWQAAIEKLGEALRTGQRGLFVVRDVTVMTNDGHFTANAHSQAEAQRIARLLNEDEARIKAALDTAESAK